MICWKILTLAVLSAEANHEMVYKREIVQYNDGLFYHEGPYVSHHQYERQARFVDSRPAPVVNTVFPQYPNYLYQNSYPRQPQLHPYQNNYQPQEPLVHNGYPPQQFLSNKYYEPQQQFKNEYFQPQPGPDQYSYKAPAISFEDQLEDRSHLKRPPARAKHHQQRLNKSLEPSVTTIRAGVKTGQRMSKSAALEMLMAIAGDDWDLNTVSGTSSGETSSDGFICPVSEGHFPSQHQCDVYYQCAQGTPHRRTCGPGLAYNIVTNQCDWSDNVQC